VQRVQDRGEFGVRETVDSDGRVRLLLVGELDHATTEGLVQRLEQLKETGSPVRLDLSELEFIDSSGIRILLITLRDARQDDWALEVDRSVSWQVERVVNVLGVDSVLWPDGAGPADGSA
jgi:anti-sigma B factor antagonist